jgi:hypothetical protein
MPEVAWSVQAAEILSLLRRYHPLLAYVQWDAEDAKTHCLVWRGCVYPDGQTGVPYAAVAALLVDYPWVNLTSAQKSLEITQLAAQLLARISAVNCLPDFHAGVETLRQWLPADAVAG